MYPFPIRRLSCASKNLWLFLLLKGAGMSIAASSAPDEATVVSTALLRAAEALGLSSAELAGIIGTSESTLSRVRNRKREGGAALLITAIILVVVGALAFTSIRHSEQESTGSARSRACSRHLPAAAGRIRRPRCLGSQRGW